MDVGIGSDFWSSSASEVGLRLGSMPSRVCRPAPAGSTSATTTLRPSWARYRPKLTARRPFPATPGPPPMLRRRGEPLGGKAVLDRESSDMVLLVRDSTPPAVVLRARDATPP